MTEDAAMLRAWAVWGVSVIAYIMTVMQRTTLGVGGLQAADRFSVSAGALSAFVFIQVAVYITAQVPAGLLVDRWGPRALLVVSGILLSLGQLVLAVATSLPLVVLARVLVGTGDRRAGKGGLGPAGYETRLLRPYGHIILDDGFRPAVGRAVPSLRPTP